MFTYVDGVFLLSMQSVGDADQCVMIVVFCLLFRVRGPSLFLISIVGDGASLRHVFMLLNNE